MNRTLYTFTVDLGEEKRQVNQSGVDADDAMDLVWANLTDADKAKVRQIELDDKCLTCGGVPSPACDHAGCKSVQWGAA